MNKKTFKRETAWVILAALLWVIFTGNVEMTQVIIWPFISFVAVAFGMDWSSKQTDLTKRRGD